MGTPVAGPDPQPVAGKALPEFQMRTVSEWAPGAMEVVTLGTKTTSRSGKDGDTGSS